MVDRNILWRFDHIHLCINVIGFLAFSLVMLRVLLRLSLFLRPFTSGTGLRCGTSITPRLVQFIFLVDLFRLIITSYKLILDP